MVGNHFFCVFTLCIGLIYSLIFVSSARAQDCEEVFVHEKVEDPARASARVVATWKSTPPVRGGTMTLVNGKLFRMDDAVSIDGTPLTAVTRNFVSAGLDKDPALSIKDLMLSDFDIMSTQTIFENDVIAGVSGGKLFIGTTSNRLNGIDGGTVGFSLRTRLTPKDLFNEGMGYQHFFVEEIPLEQGAVVTKVEWAPLRVAGGEVLYVLYVTAGEQLHTLTVRPPKPSKDRRVEGHVEVVSRSTTRVPTSSLFVPLSAAHQIFADEDEIRLWEQGKPTQQSLKYPEGFAIELLKAVPSLSSTQQPEQLQLSRLHIWAFGKQNGKQVLYSWDATSGWFPVPGLFESDKVLAMDTLWVSAQPTSREEPSYAQILREGELVRGRERMVVSVMRPDDSGSFRYVIRGVSQEGIVDLPWNFFATDYPKDWVSVKENVKNKINHLEEQWRIPQANSHMIMAQPLLPEAWSQALHKQTKFIAEPNPYCTSMPMTFKKVFEELTGDKYRTAAFARNNIAAILTHAQQSTASLLRDLNMQAMHFHHQWLMIATFQRTRFATDLRLGNIALPDVNSAEWRTLREVLNVSPKEALRYGSIVLDETGSPYIDEGYRAPDAPKSFWDIQKDNIPEFLRKRMAIQSIIEAIAAMYRVDAGTFREFLLLVFNKSLDLENDDNKAVLVPTLVEQLQLERDAVERFGRATNFADAVYYAIMLMDPLARDAFTLGE